MARQESWCGWRQRRRSRRRGRRCRRRRRRQRRTVTLCLMAASWSSSFSASAGRCRGRSSGRGGQGGAGPEPDVDESPEGEHCKDASCDRHHGNCCDEEGTRRGAFDLDASLGCRIFDHQTSLGGAGRPCDPRQPDYWGRTAGPPAIGERRLTGSLWREGVPILRPEERLCPGRVAADECMDADVAENPFRRFGFGPYGACCPGCGPWPVARLVVIPSF